MLQIALFVKVQARMTDLSKVQLYIMLAENAIRESLILGFEKPDLFLG
jgi:hypothetical protein